MCYLQSVLELNWVVRHPGGVETWLCTWKAHTWYQKWPSEVRAENGRGRAPSFLPVLTFIKVTFSKGPNLSVSVSTFLIPKQQFYFLANLALLRLIWILNKLLELIRDKHHINKEQRALCIAKWISEPYVFSQANSRPPVNLCTQRTLCVMTLLPPHLSPIWTTSFYLNHPLFYRSSNCSMQPPSRANFITVSLGALLILP